LNFAENQSLERAASLNKAGAREGKGSQEKGNLNL